MRLLLSAKRRRRRWFLEKRRPLMLDTFGSPASAKAVVEQLKKQVADLSRGRREVAHYRCAAHGGRPARQRRRGRPTVRQVRNAGHEGRTRGEQGRGEKRRQGLRRSRQKFQQEQALDGRRSHRETIAARPGDGAIDLPVQILVTTGTPARRRFLPPRSTGTSARISLASTRSAVPRCRSS